MRLSLDVCNVSRTLSINNQQPVIVRLWVVYRDLQLGSWTLRRAVDGSSDSA